MILHQILPAALRYSSDLAESVERKHKAGIRCRAESELAQRLSQCCDRLYDEVEALHRCIKATPEDFSAAAQYCSSVIVPAMVTARKDADLLEKLAATSYWPYPTYSDILFY